MNRPPAVRRVDPARRIIITPEGLSLPLTLAGRGARLGALLLDLAIIGLVIFLSIVAFIYLVGNLVPSAKNKLGVDSASSAMQFLYILFVIGGFLLHNGWFLFFELGPRGATPGKRALGIRVAAQGGGQLTPEMVIARNLLRDIELFMPLAFIAMAGTGNGGPAGIVAAGWFLLFALFPFFNRDRLRAGDLIAGTWVVEAQKRRLLPVMSLDIARSKATASARPSWRSMASMNCRHWNAYCATTAPIRWRRWRRQFAPRSAGPRRAPAKPARSCRPITPNCALGWKAAGGSASASRTSSRARLRNGLAPG
jgi:uncharacterized RDD family membrane protein YckC